MLESVNFVVENLDGKNDLKQIKRELDGYPGVNSVSVSMRKHRVAVDYDDTGVTFQQLEGCLNRLGYRVSDGINA